MMLRILILLLLVFLQQACAQIQAHPSISDSIRIVKSHGALTLANGRVDRRIIFSETDDSPVLLSTAFRGDRAARVVQPGGGLPWFEVHINGRQVSNRDPIWRFRQFASRVLENGGKEVVVEFSSRTKPLAGLRLIYKCQVFPASSIVRERIILTADRGARHQLTVVNGEPLFVFPSYEHSVGSSVVVESRFISLSSWGRELIAENPGVSFDERSLETGSRVGKNLAQNYMYHPATLDSSVRPGGRISHKGPILLLRNRKTGLGCLSAYEHGSPDDDPEQQYAVQEIARTESSVSVRTVYRTGIIYNDQPLTAEAPFVSPWHISGTFDGSEWENGTGLLWEYLQCYANESPYSRVPRFYYNTWGMQRDEERRGNDVRGVLTPDRVTREMSLAAMLNVDLFVLDDGWQDRFGDWNPDPARYPDGLAWYVRECKRHGFIPGIWMAALATDPDAKVAQDHPEWLIRDAKGNPIVGRWDKEIFCLASDYRRYFVEKCKRLIDEGIRFFKWDGIDKHLCASPLHHHGTASNSEVERKQNMGFAVPLQVAGAIRQLKEYCPDVVVEVDVTEPLRSVGLAVLSEGKYFWMNNGGSSYGDYGPTRAISTRFIPNLYGSILPPSLMNYASYPHNAPPSYSSRYNVNSCLLGGRGFWGNLTSMERADLERVGGLVVKARRVAEVTSIRPPRISGPVGSSPEIYEWFDAKRALGQIIGFSGSASAVDYLVKGVEPLRILAVLNNAYDLSGDSLVIPLRFPAPEVSREAFILPNRGVHISISRSSSWLDDASIVGSDTLFFVNGAPGNHEVLWDVDLGQPDVVGDKPLSSRVTLDAATGMHRIKIATEQPSTRCRVFPKK
jgi:hypothetical protein